MEKGVVEGERVPKLFVVGGNFRDKGGRRSPSAVASSEDNGRLSKLYGPNLRSCVFVLEGPLDDIRKFEISSELGPLSSLESMYLLLLYVLFQFVCPPFIIIDPISVVCRFPMHVTRTHVEPLS